MRLHHDSGKGAASVAPTTPTIIAASARADVRALAAQKSKVQGPKAGVHLLVPKFKDMIRWDEHMWREMREGGRLWRYLQRERGTSRRRQQAVSRRMQGFKQNFKSDMQLVAAVPAREFFRWKQEDPDFWADNKNLKSLKRDNPDMPIYV